MTPRNYDAVFALWQTSEGWVPREALVAVQQAVTACAQSTGG